jgi:hypothetical protein
MLTLRYTAQISPKTALIRSHGIQPRLPMTYLEKFEVVKKQKPSRDCPTDPVADAKMDIPIESKWESKWYQKFLAPEGEGNGIRNSPRIS